MRIVKQVLTPAVQELEDKQIDSFTLTMFLASWLKELLDEMNDKDKKELILRRMLD